MTTTTISNPGLFCFVASINWNEGLLLWVNAVELAGGNSFVPV
jgi:hypothetical protein